MKVKSEKGFTLIDITVAIIVLMILIIYIVILAFMSLIAVIFFNITKSSKSIERESDATYLATTVIEDIKAQEYDNIALTSTTILNDNNISTENAPTVQNYSYINGKKVNISIPDGYLCKIQIQNYVPSNRTNANTDLLKLVLVEVSYKVGGERNAVQLKTSIVNNNN